MKISKIILSIFVSGFMFIGYAANTDAGNTSKTESKTSVKEVDANSENSKSDTSISDIKGTVKDTAETTKEAKSMWNDVMSVVKDVKDTFK